jgi:hypothetical protein
VDKEAYLTTVSRYIHLNPVRISGFKKMEVEKKFHYLCIYKWSSLPGYIDQSKMSDFIDYDSVLAEYGGYNPTGRQRYRQQITEDLESGPEIKNRIVGQSILGSDDFVSGVQEKYVVAKKDRERPSVGRVHRHISQEAILAIVEQEIGMQQQALYTTGTTRQIAMTMLYKYAGMNNREIGDLLGIDYSTVSQGRSRLRKKVTEEKYIGLLVQRIEQICQE